MSDGSPITHTGRRRYRPCCWVPSNATNRDAKPLDDPALARRVAISSTAAALFATRGYSATRIADLANTAGITRASIYYVLLRKQSMIVYDILTHAAHATIEAAQAARSTSAQNELYQCTVDLIRASAANPHAAAVCLQVSPYLSEWITAHQLDDIRYSESLPLSSATATQRWSHLANSE